MSYDHLLRRSIDWLAPRLCAFCGLRCVGDERYVCGGCHEDMPWFDEPAERLPEPFAASVTPLAYEFPVDAAIKALKFRHRLGYVSALVELMLAALPSLPDGIDAVLPVPLHWRRRLRRGFNQSLELAQPLARRLDAPLLENVVRCKATPFQSGLGERERLRNLCGAFRVRGRLEAQHVLIVDDVTTTGATARELARVLRRHGASDVSLLTLARTCSSARYR